MKQCAKIPLQQFIVLTFIFKMRCQTTKSYNKILRSCIATVKRSANMKCSGTCLEVSRSRLAELCGIGKGGNWGWRHTATYISVGILKVGARGNLSIHFSNFRFVDPNSARSPLLTKLFNSFFSRLSNLTSKLQHVCRDSNQNKSSLTKKIIFLLSKCARTKML